MATSTLPIFFFISSISLLVSCSFTNAKTPQKPKAFIFPIKKDNTTNQYYTRIQIGSNITTFNVVIDLGGKFLWFNDLDYFNAASSYRPILCGSRQCGIANGAGCTNCSDSSAVPGCTNNTCSDDALNPFSGVVGYGGLGLDVLRVYSTRRDQHKVNSFPFQFSDPYLLGKLARPTAGVIGLGRTRISLPAQLASTFKIPHKFALCIPASGNNGNLIVGDATYRKPFSIISDSLFTTPLVKNPVSTYGNDQNGNFSVEYFIKVKSIKVGGTSLALNKTLLSIDKKTGDGGAGIRTVRAYTALRTSIYKTLIKEFVKATFKMSIKRVASVAPFGACFNSKTITGSKTGPNVPIIDLVLQRNSVYWRFYGANSMVSVGNNVMCLAFVEEKPYLVADTPVTSIVIGGYQMENHLVEFDVAKSRLGFSSSLLLHDTSCSQFGAA